MSAGDTLFSISSRLAGESAFDRARLADAIVAANPRAFVGGDANRLLAGAMLRVPLTAQGLAALAPGRNDAPVAPAPVLVAEVAPADAAA